VADFSYPMFHHFLNERRLNHDYDVGFSIVQVLHNDYNSKTNNERKLIMKKQKHFSRFLLAIFIMVFTFSLFGQEKSRVKNGKSLDQIIPLTERYSSGLLNSLDVSSPTLDGTPLKRFGLSKAGLGVGPNVVMSAPFDPTPGVDLRARSELSITSDPSGMFLVAGWNDAQGFLHAPFGPLPALGLSGYAFSADGGKTWTDGGAPFIFGTPGVVTRGDPWLATGGPGQKTYYYANLAVLEDNSNIGSMVVHRGTFTDNIFAFDHAVYIPAPNPGDGYDKESICAGKSDGTQDMVVVATTNFTAAGGTAIEAFVSNDQATTFTRTIVQPAEGAPLNQGADCAIDFNGRIYVLWERGRLSPFLGQAGIADPEIYIARSDDGGATFTSRILVSSISSGSLWPPSGFNRQTTNDFPRLAVATEGPYKGRVYAAYQDSRIANGGVMPAPLGPEDIAAGFGLDVGHWDTDIYLRYSDDHGVTWSAPELVAGGNDGNIQFFPVVSVDPNGRVSIVYYESVEPEGTDFANGPTPYGDKDSYVDVYYVSSTDGGSSFSAPEKVTDVTTNWNVNVSLTNIYPNFGDYIGFVSKSNNLSVAWADGRNGLPEAFFAKVRTGKLNKDNIAESKLDQVYTLKQNYPNPFNPTTQISFEIPEDGNVKLKIYNSVGQLVKTLVDENMSKGYHQINWNASDNNGIKLSSGIYFYSLTSGSFVESKKMILMK
jgi:hypothetical protein